MSALPVLEHAQQRLEKTAAVLDELERENAIERRRRVEAEKRRKEAEYHQQQAEFRLASVTHLIGTLLPIVDRIEAEWIRHASQQQQQQAPLSDSNNNSTEHLSPRGAEIAANRRLILEMKHEIEQLRGAPPSQSPHWPLHGHRSPGWTSPASAQPDHPATRSLEPLRQQLRTLNDELSGAVAPDPLSVVTIMGLEGEMKEAFGGLQAETQIH